MPSPGDSDDLALGVITALREMPGILEAVEHRIYPGHLPQGANLPAIVVSFVGGSSDEVLTGPSGLAEGRIQIDVYGHIWRDKNQLARLVRDGIYEHVRQNRALGDVHVHSALKVNELDTDEPPINASDEWRYRRILEFDITYCELVF